MPSCTCRRRVLVELLGESPQEGIGAVVTRSGWHSHSVGAMRIVSREVMASFVKFREGVCDMHGGDRERRACWVYYM